MLGQQQRGKHRRDGERRHQRADQREPIGLRHGAEDLAFHALHGEERDECRHRDRGGEEDRLVDLQGADKDQTKAIGPQLTARRIGRSGRIGPKPSLGKVLQGRLLFFRSRLEIPEYVLDQDHRRIDDDAEVDGADRQQVCVLAEQHQHDDAEKQRERDVDADDDGAAQVAQEDPLDEENQQATEDKVVQDRVGGDRHERGAVIIRNELDPRR